MGIELNRASANKALSIFSLAMINIIAVDSLRTLSFGAKLGTTLLFYYAVCAIFYFLPVGLVTAELATTWPKKGGIYVWVKEAFGIKSGFLVVWLQWVYNVIWYPTILAMVIGILCYLIEPSLAKDKLFTFISVTSIFWLTTILNSFGIRVSSIVSIIGSIFGTLIPMLVIISLGFIWISGEHKQINWEIIPKVNKLSDMTLMVTVMFGLVGLEMSAVHANDVKNPKRDYPLALLISGVLIIATLVVSSLMIALVVPAKDLSLVVGIMQALKIFFGYIKAPWLLNIFGACVILGALCSVSTWIIGPTKGLLAVAEDNGLPGFFAHKNKYESPSNLLILQAFIVTILSALYLLMPEVEEAYLLLTQLTAILALFMYLLMFAAAIVLRYKKPNVNRPFKLPFGNIGMWVVSSSGILICLFAVVLSFIPPSQIEVKSSLGYTMLLVAGCIVFSLPALLVKSGKSSDAT